MGYARQNKVRWTVSSMPGIEFETFESPEISIDAEYRNRKVGRDGKTLVKSEVMYGEVSGTAWISTSENSDLRTPLLKGDLSAHENATVNRVDIDDDDVPIPGTEASYIATLKSYKEDGMDANASDIVKSNLTWVIKGAVG